MSNKTVTVFTEGKILGPLVKFALPVLLALFLQNLYGAVDLMIIGQFSVASDVSAVATGSGMMFTLTTVFIGLAMGATILLGQNCWKSIWKYYCKRTIVRPKKYNISYLDV